ELYERLADALSRLTGVAAAAASVTTPLNGSVWGGNTVEVPGAAALPERESTALVNFVTPGWFATYGIPLMAGRGFDPRDTTAGQQVAIVNTAFARRFLGDRSAVGQSVVQPDVGHAKEIVGVVADSLFADVRETVHPTLYFPLRQFDWPGTLPGMSLSIRSI